MKNLDSSGKPEVVPPARDSCDGLVSRIASSSVFQKSNRLRELFLFLCERALSEPEASIHESEIGIGVFGRQPGYDTAQDPLVRVQVSQLRKKLQQYFSTEGRDEPVIIEIPRGAYTPVFSSRPPEPAADQSPEVPEPANRPRASRLTVLLVLATVASLAVAGWGWLRPVPFRTPDSGQAVGLLWRQVFSNGRPTCVVLSDPNLVLFEAIIKHQLTADEYKRKDFRRLVNELLTDPKQRSSATALVMSHSVTHIADAQLAAVFAAMNTSRQIATDIVPSRDFGVGYLRSHNVVLLGSLRSNPWMELFETQLNFRSVFQDTEPPVSYFQNVSPLAGEAERYNEEWAFRGYCRVAYLPNPTRNGSVVLISGSDMASTEAGGEFISSERWIKALQSRLGLAPRAPFPFFEVLLRVEYLTKNTTPRFTMVAHRVPKL